jgi:hypothetical protein
MPLEFDQDQSSTNCPSASKSSGVFNVWSFLSASVGAVTTVVNVVATINSNNNYDLNNNSCEKWCNVA